MKKLLFLCLCLCALSARAATVITALTNFNATLTTNAIRITLMTGPQVDGTFIQTGLPILTPTTNGAATNVLLGGTYRLEIVGLSYPYPTYFAVPTNDAGTYPVTQLLISGGNIFNYTPPSGTILAGTNVTIQTNGIVVTVNATGAGTTVTAGTNVTTQTNGAEVTVNATGGGGSTNFITATGAGKLLDDSGHVLIFSNQTLYAPVDAIDLGSVADPFAAGYFQSLGVGRFTASPATITNLTLSGPTPSTVAGINSGGGVTNITVGAGLSYNTSTLTLSTNGSASGSGTGIASNGGTGINILITNLTLSGPSASSLASLNASGGVTNATVGTGLTFTGNTLATNGNGLGSAAALASNAFVLSASGFATNPTVSGTIAGNPTVSGNWTFTNNPQTIQPRFIYATNAAFSGAINTVHLTATSGTFTGWIPGDSIAFQNGEQYTVLHVDSSTQISVSGSLQSTHTSDTTATFYPHAFESTDINGNHYGFMIDDGGNIVLGDSDSLIPAISILPLGQANTSLGGFAMYFAPGSGLLGPWNIRMGGNSSYGSAQANGFELSTMAPYDSLYGLSNGMYSFKYGITNKDGVVTNYTLQQFPQGSAQDNLTVTNAQTNLALVTNGLVSTDRNHQFTNFVGTAGQTVVFDSTQPGGWKATNFPAGGSGLSTSDAIVAIGNPADAPNSRSLIGTANEVIVTDGGANSTVTLSMPQAIGTLSTPQFFSLGLNAAADSTNRVRVESDALGATSSNGVYAVNTTAAANNTQQWSPPVLWEGQGWKTTSTAASQPVRFRSYVVPVQGAANPTGTLTFDSSINGAAFANPINFNSDGSLSLQGGNIQITSGASIVTFSTRGQFNGGTLQLYSTGYVAFANGSVANGTMDTGMSRISAGVMGFGNGTQGDTTAVVESSGFFSKATNTPVAITSTGITNNMGKNAKVFLTATAVTYTNFNNAGTAYKTNTLTGTLVFDDILQPGGSVQAASGLAGELVPF